MIRAAITGGIACGKSTVLQMFAELPHVAVLSADRVVHQLYEPGEPTYNAVVQEFGRGILGAAGKIDRKRLADAAMAKLRGQNENADYTNTASSLHKQPAKSLKVKE